MVLGDENVGSSERPPNPLAGTFRRNFSHSPWRPTLVRHASFMMTKTVDATTEEEKSRENCESDFTPIVRSGGWADIGFRRSMEDAYIFCDNLKHEYGLKNFGEEPGAFYGVFDGHGGKHAADFACSNLPRFICEDVDFPREIEKVVSSAFLQTDCFRRGLHFGLCSRFWYNCIGCAGSWKARLPDPFYHDMSLVVANAGDCRAVLCRRGKAIEVSRDHKPACIREQKRIEALGGYVYDGYLNGQLNVTRALGDWHMEGLKDRGGGLAGPLIAEPEVTLTKLTDEDEFLIIGCDGIWDVFRSQNAVDFARWKLREHNDPTTCCKELVDEALKRKSGDNVAVVVVCFQSKPPPALAMPRSRVQRSISAEGLKELQGFLDSLKA